MPRLELALPLLAALAVACADDSTAMTTGTDDTTTSATTSGSDASSDGPTSAPTGTATLTTDVTTTVPGTTGPDPTTATATVTSEPTTATTEPGTTTDGGVCGPDSQSVGAALVHTGEPPACGPLEFTGTRTSPQKGPMWQLDGCACGDTCLIPDPWSFSVQAPAAWLPLMPACPRIVVDREQGPGGCRFVAVSVWDLEAPGEPAVYHAGHGLAPTQAAAGELLIAGSTTDTCACDDCCQTSELWDLVLTLAGQPLPLAEGESGQLGQRDAINFESHEDGLCDAPVDAPPAVYWAIRRPA